MNSVKLSGLIPRNCYQLIFINDDVIKIGKKK